MRRDWYQCSYSAAEHRHHGERPPSRRHAIHVLCTIHIAAPFRRLSKRALRSVGMIDAFFGVQTPVTVPLQAGMRSNSSFLDLNDPTLPGANATGQTPTQVRLLHASMIRCLFPGYLLSLIARTCMLARQMHASVCLLAVADRHVIEVLFIGSNQVDLVPLAR